MSFNARKILRISCCFALVLGLAGCVSFNVQSDWDDDVSFEPLQRFAWLEPPAAERPDPFADNSLLRKRVRETVEERLTARGFRSVAVDDSPDFLVTWAVTLDDELRVNGGSGVGVGFGGPFRAGWGVGGYSTGGSVRNYQESTLVIDFLTPDGQTLVWRGWGTGVVSTRDRNRREDRMTAGVNAILDAFPPRGARR